MRQLKDKELEGLDFFRELREWELPERVLKYRTNVIVIGGAVLFLISADVTIEGFTLGLIQGKLSRTWVPSLFVALFFIYNAWMLEILSKSHRERAWYKYARRESFGVAIAKHILLEEIIACGGDEYRDQEIAKNQLSRATIMGTDEEGVVVLEMPLDSRHNTSLVGRLQERDGIFVFAAGLGNSVRLHYRITEMDQQFLQRNYRLIDAAIRHRFADVVLPQLLSGVVLVAITCSCLGTIFRD